MSESTVSPAQGPDFWKEHVLTAQSFVGSDVEYCRRNGLNPATFSAYKVKLGFSKHSRQRAQARGFIKIEPKKDLGGTPPAAELRTVGPRQQQQRVLPDSKWLADFVSALFSQE